MFERIWDALAANAAIIRQAPVPFFLAVTLGALGGFWAGEELSTHEILDLKQQVATAQQDRDYWHDQLDVARRDALRSGGERPLQNYGFAPNVVLWADVDTSKISAGEHFAVILIGVVVYKNVDKATDANTAVSAPHSIDGSVIKLSANGMGHLRVTPDIVNPVSVSIAVIPTSVESNDIHSLSDVEKVGGHIVDTAGIGLPVTAVFNMQTSPGIGSLP